MPELAEVETLKRYLYQNIVGEKIVLYNQFRNNLRYELDKNLAINIPSSTILDIKRRAKYINIFLSNKNILTYHLGMSGRITLQPDFYQKQKHDHVILSFESGKQLVFNDARRFGMVYICNEQEQTQQKYFAKMGMEPLTDEFNKNYLKEKICNKNSAIKLALMANEIVVGVGNIYAAESLFMAKINPFRAANTLTDEEIELLVNCVKQVLLKAIESGGTTLRDFVSGDSRPGYFSQELNVYGRHNMPCSVCSEPVQKIKQAGRSTFFCAVCQK